MVDWIPALLGIAVLLPLASFALILLAGPKMGKGGSLAAYVATAAIVCACVLSFISLKLWLGEHPVVAATHHGEHHDGHDSHGGHGDSHDTHGDDHASLTPVVRFVSVNSDEAASESDKDSHGGDDDAGHGHGHGNEHAAHGGHDSHGHHGDGHAAGVPPHITGNWYTLADFGKLKLAIGYYIDGLTLAMFCMVTLIASCIHFYAMGYMHDEEHDFTDHEVTLADGSHLTRPGRYHRFFQALSLFCFSMLGLIIAGNVAMTFVFWELVGICSYFLIGFYVERHSASTAANKAFIVNRVGDFGMIIGLMALWGSLGTFNYGDIDGPGLFSQVRPAATGHAFQVPDGMVKVASVQAAEGEEVPAGGYGYWLLIVAGVGIFCGCIGKSAQFPLHVWLPDAMEGPTPVSALVHSATMVAAGVFLVSRFYPVFAPEVLLVIAIVGTITLFMAATIAITATDIKRVLAYSTVSQLGYMMMALGVGGWLAGTLHLFTHAFFKSLLFMCSGSVIHGVHTNEMTEMGGLRKKMPWTAYTMLIGCLAIAGAGIPFVIGFSGYYSKDAILEQALSFGNTNPGWGPFFFYAAAGGAAITAFYMFRLWYMTFAGKPRDEHRYDHAHESPGIMYRPLVLLSILAVSAAWHPKTASMGLVLAAIIFAAIVFRDRILKRGTSAGDPSWLTLPVGLILAIGLVWLFYGGVALPDLLEQARPAGTLAGFEGQIIEYAWPNEHDSHAPAVKVPATWVAFFTALGGFLLATVCYCFRWLDVEEAKASFRWLHNFLINKWWFDELYDVIWVRPTKFLGGIVSAIDRRWLDGLIHALADGVKSLSRLWERFIDRGMVDGSVNKAAGWTHSLGLALRGVQTGRLRQYVLFVVLGTVAFFVLASFFWGYAFAG